MKDPRLFKINAFDEGDAIVVQSENYQKDKQIRLTISKPFTNDDLIRNIEFMLEEIVGIL